MDYRKLCLELFGTDDVEKLKDIHLTKDSPKEDYRVLKYIKDDPIIVSTRVPQDISYVEYHINLCIDDNEPHQREYLYLI